MQRRTVRLAVFGGMIWTLIAASPASAQHQGHGSMASAGAGTTGPGAPSGTFTHEVVDQGVRVEFQIMSMATMKMKDPGGATHHVMVKFVREGTKEQIPKVMVRMRAVSPSGKDQVETLKEDGGIYVAGFTFAERGTYGVTCVFKVGDQQHLVKFSYPQS
jgi:hypothetical protein